MPNKRTRTCDRLAEPRNVETLEFRDASLIENPHDHFLRWREEKGPVAWHEGKNAWIVIGYKEAHDALKSKSFSVRTATTRILAAGEEFAPLAQLVAGFLTRLDPPQHTRLRQLVLRAFTPRTISGMQSAIAGRIEGLLGQKSGDLDLMSVLAVPLPVGVICDLLGVPPEDQTRVKHWSDLLGGIADLDPEPNRLRLALEASEQFAAFVDELVTQQRGHHTESLLSALVEVEQEGDKLGREELFGLCQVLLIAGQETTTCLLGNACHLLAHREDLQQALRDDPETIPAFVEECVRWESPVQIRTRLAVEDAELGPASIKAGQAVQILIGAANRDPAVFESPEQVRLDRKPNHHLGFGEGPHYCLGAALARLETRLALQYLLENGRLSPHSRATPPSRGQNFSLRGFTALPLNWSRSTD